MNKLPVIDVYAARLLMISFFLPMGPQAVAVGVVSLYFVFRTVQEKQKISGSNFLWALVLGGGYLLYLFAFQLTPDVYKGRLLMICGNKASFLFMPFIFAIISPGFGQLIRRELSWFVYGCFISCVLSNAAIIYKYYFISGGLHELSHVHYRMSFEHYSGIHPTYMAMYQCFSICILLYWSEFSGVGGRIVRYVLLYSLLLFFLALFAKSPLIALIIIVIHHAFVHRKTLYQYKLVFAGLLAAVAAAWVFIPFVSQRVNETLQSGNEKAGRIMDNSVYVRKHIWGVDMDLLRRYWLTGIGPGRLFEIFRERFLFYSLGSNTVLFIHDPHNEYVYEWLCFGLLGIIVFAAVLLVYLIKAIRAKNYLFLYLLIILYITFFTETVLSTQRGILFYAVFTAMMFYGESAKRLKS